MTLMDCEACTDRLVDLLYGELDEAEAESARTHLAGCESCAAALARLERGQELATMLVLEEPPATVRNAVLAAARERAATRAAVHVPDAAERRPASEPREPRREREDDDEDGGLWASFLRWLGSLAMGPQVAMAMMLLLMIGIGLWYLPGLRSRDPGDAHAILDPAPGDEVGPSQGLEPAAPLDLEADPRTGRIRPRDDQPPPAPRHAQRTPPPAEPAEITEADDGEARDEDRLELAEAEAPAVVPAPEERAEPTQRRDRAPRAGVEQEAQAAALPDEPAAPPAMLAMDVAPGDEVLPHRQEAEPAPARSYPVEQAQAPAYAGAAPSPSPVPRSRAAAPIPQAPSTPSQRAPEPAAEGVVGPPSPGDSRHALAQAAHQRALTLRSQGQCRAAIPAYQRLLTDSPTYARAHEARLELADCYRQTGNLTMARRLYEQLARDPRVASRAQRELVRLEAAERAMGRAAQTERTPDRPAPQQDLADEATSGE